MLASGKYLAGLEPANCSIFGRSADRLAGTLQTLKPRERRTSGVTVAVVPGSRVHDLIAEHDRQAGAA